MGFLSNTCGARQAAMPASTAVVVTYAVSAIAGGICAGATGFGSSIIFHVVSMVLFAAFGLGDADLVRAVSFLAVMNLCMYSVAFNARKQINPALVVLIVVPASLGVLCGTFVLVGSSQTTLKLVFGVRRTFRVVCMLRHKRVFTSGLAAVLAWIAGILGPFCAMEVVVGAHTP